MYWLDQLFKRQENVYIDREDFLKSVKELNIYVKEVGHQAIAYEYTDWLNPDDNVKNREALDRMVGDYAFSCPVVEFANRFVEFKKN